MIQELHLHRDVLAPGWTLGVFYADELIFGHVCEDFDRLRLGQAKVKGQTAIPAGRYRVLSTWSPKYGRNVLEVQAVPGFRGIRIHSGNTAEHTEGCLLPGLTRDEVKGTVGSSARAVAWLEKHIPAEGCWLTIGYEAPAG